MPAARRLTRAPAGRPGGRGDRPGTVSPADSAAGPRRLSPTVIALLVATAAGLALRAFLLCRPGFLTGGTVEYDDGVYLGTALRLLHGALPYRDYAYVQPPGILLISTPFALIGTLTSQVTGLAVARAASVLASTACIPLAGNLMKHRGTLAAAVAAGVLAVYPADVLSSRTLLLEPWMNLLCLLGANAAFTAGRLAGPRRLAWAGVAIGFAASVKFWAMLPAALLLAACLLAGESRIRRAAWLAAGLAAGFVVPVAPFAAAAPAAFIRQAVFYQASRTGSSVPFSLRLANLTGLIDILDKGGRVWLGGTVHQVFAVATNATTADSYVGWPSYAVALVVAAVFAAGYLRASGERSVLEWFTLVTALLAAVAISFYSAFFYHYPDFPAPWLAIAAGAAAAGLAGFGARRLLTRLIAAAVAVIIVAAFTVEAREIRYVRVPTTPAAVDQIVPAGACLIADQMSLAIAANRFAPPSPGCPDVLDSLATTLALSGGVSPQGGAGSMPKVVAGWESTFAQARYVWLSGGFRTRIPWPPALQAWFTAHFRLAAAYPQYADSNLYVNKS